MKLALKRRRPARQRIDRDIFTAARREREQCRATRHDGVEPARFEQLGERSIAESVSERCVGMDQIAVGQDADCGRHCLEQRDKTGPFELEPFERAVFIGHRQSRSAQDAAFQHAGDVFEGLAVGLHLFDAGGLSGIGHG